MTKIIKVTIATVAILMFQTISVSAHGIYTSENSVTQDITYHMANRDNAFSVQYSGDATSFINDFNTVVKNAYSTDDYLSLSWTKISPTAKFANGTLQVDFNVDYVATKDQEAYSDNVLKSAVKSIITPYMSTAEKVQAINKYISDKYSYDYTLTSRSVYQALTTSKAVCQNYSMTAYRMLQDAGIENHIVVGSIPSGSHAWNKVNIDGNWYNLDTTNDDALNSSKYYLVSDKVLSDNGFVWDKSLYPQSLNSYVDTSVNDKALVNSVTAMVVTAEKNKTDYYVNKANDGIAQLKSSPEKTSLTNRVNAVTQIILQNKITSATNAVVYAEKYKTQAFISIADGAVKLLPDGTVKTSFESRMNVIKSAKGSTIGSNTQASIDRAKTDMLNAERYQTDYYIKIVEADINSLSSCQDKTDLVSRLNKIYAKLDAVKVSSINSYLDMAVKYNKKIYLDTATKYLADIKDPNTKSQLQNKINGIAKLNLK